MIESTDTKLRIAVHWVARVACGLISVAMAKTGPTDFKTVLKNVMTQPDPDLKLKTYFDTKKCLKLTQLQGLKKV